METVVAMAIFCLALLPVFPMLAQAGRYAAASQEAYRAQRMAEGLLMTVKEAASAGADLSRAAEAYVRSLPEAPAHYGYWVRFPEEEIIFSTSGAPDWPVTAASAGLPLSARTFYAVAAVLLSDDGVSAHAAGMGVCVDH
jgi:type II secretory pathway pseudopilin PulG